MKRILSWLYAKLLRDRVLHDCVAVHDFLTATKQPNTLYVVHLYGGRGAVGDMRDQPGRWN